MMVAFKRDKDVLNWNPSDLDGIAADESPGQRRLEDALQWNYNADNAFRSLYTKDSRATSYRKIKTKSIAISQ